MGEVKMELCKVRNCLGVASHQAVFVVRVFSVPGAPPVVIDTPMLVCKDHCNEGVKNALKTDENWGVIVEVFREKEMRDPDPDHADVHFKRLVDPQVKSKLIYIPGGR